MIIVGLGNPGKEYASTRHNVGFDVVDQLVKELHGSWKKEKGVAWSMVGKQYFIKPLQFMNVSGQSLLTFMKYKKMTWTSPADLIIVHDEIDFPLGEVHEQLKRSAGGHNGVKSIIDTLGTQNFTRYRIGIGNNREVGLPAEDYVLQKFSKDERVVIDKAIADVVTTLKQKVSA